MSARPAELDALDQQADTPTKALTHVIPTSKDLLNDKKCRPIRSSTFAACRASTPSAPRTSRQRSTRCSREARDAVGSASPRDAQPATWDRVVEPLAECARPPRPRVGRGPASQRRRQCAGIARRLQRQPAEGRRVLHRHWRRTCGCSRNIARCAMRPPSRRWSLRNAS